MDSKQWPDAASLRAQLLKIDGRGYPAYKQVAGGYRLEEGLLFIDHVQGDPFAAPSRLRFKVDFAASGLGATNPNNDPRRNALRDFLARCFVAETNLASRKLGSGKSGLLTMARPGQEILERSSIVLGENYLEARFVAGLPANGRRILGRQAEKLLLETIPTICRQSLFLDALDRPALEKHLNTNEDAETLRGLIAEKGLISFVADGAILPRRSGVDPRPMGAQTIPFKSPDSLRVSFTLPHAGKVHGMGIPRGITVIAGGGFHGKSTLLSALENGVYNHIPGDGRELVVTDPTALKIRAEDNRAVHQVDLRPFIGELPGGRSTSRFSTENASGSTSQAANLMEGLEAGAKVFLLDEDTCATNLMIRDARMQALVTGASEPITPFIERARYLAEDLGVSSVLVSGGSGDYLEIADTVLRMQDYHCVEVTTEARRIVQEKPTGRSTASANPWPVDTPVRLLDSRSLDPSKGSRPVRILSQDTRSITFGTSEIDLSAVSQIIDPAQTRALADALLLVKNLVESTDRAEDNSIPEILARIHDLLKREGLNALSNGIPTGDHAAFRPLELAATLNRLRSLRLPPPNYP